MKQLIFAFSIVCAGAYIANAEQVAPWFRGYADGTSAQGTGGAWTNPVPEGVEIADSQFTLDLDADEEFRFTPTASDAPDTNVMTRVLAKAAFVRYTGTMPTFSDETVKTAFAVCSNEDHFAYCAYIGNAWKVLSGATPAKEDVLVSVLTEIDYKTTTPNVCFAIVTGDTVLTTNYLYEASTTPGIPGVTNFALAAYSGSERLIKSVSLAGSGTLESIDGVVQLGVAAYDGVKYPTVNDAVAAAGDTPNAKVTLLRDVADKAEIPANVTIDTNGKQMAGEVTVAAGATLETSANTDSIDLTNYTLPAEGKVNLKLNNAAEKITSGSAVVATGAKDGDQNKILVLGNNTYKDYSALRISQGTIVCDIKTSDAQVNGITVTAGNVQLAGLDNSDLRVFLNEYIEITYKGANSSSANMADALQNDAVNNGMALWKSFVLGLNPNDATSKPEAVVKPATESSEGMVLTMPTYKPTDDLPESNFTVQYQLMKSSDGSDWKAEGDPITDATTISVPFNTGSNKYQYRVDTVVVPKN